MELAPADYVLGSYDYMISIEIFYIAEFLIIGC